MKLPITQIPAPRFERGRHYGSPKHAVIHFSVGSGNPHATARYFTRTPKRAASYHFEVARDGTQTQLVDTMDTAWHAGTGVPLGVTDCRTVPRRVNRESVGIVLGNWGHMTPEQAERRGIDRGDCIESSHRAFGNPRNVKLWQRYTDAQYNALGFLLIVLVSHHPTIRCLTGHEDHERAKSDPGPAFEWARVCRMAHLPYMHHEWETGRWLMKYDHRGEKVG